MCRNLSYCATQHFYFTFFILFFFIFEKFIDISEPEVNDAQSDPHELCQRETVFYCIFDMLFIRSWPTLMTILAYSL